MNELLKWLQAKLQENEKLRLNGDSSAYQQAKLNQEHSVLKEIINHIIKEHL